MDCIIIHVQTGDKMYAGTDANVQIVLRDDCNHSSAPIILDNFLSDDFERGNLDSFPVPAESMSSISSPVKIAYIEFWKDGAGFGTDWFVDRIEVENKTTGSRFIFPIFRWIKPGIHYHIKLLDTSLPQFEEFQDQRRQGLADKQKVYELDQKIHNGPVQVKTLPGDESFSFDYKWDIAKKSIGFKALIKVLMGLKPRDFSSIDDISTVYDGDTFAAPKNIDRWNDDAQFGMQRLIGVNASMITLAKQIPEKFPVTDELVGPFLEGSTIQEQLTRKKLFIIDLAILDGIPKREGFVICAPICLFYLDSANNLKPVAIQLHQKPGPCNPIFTPSSPALTWGLVKLWYNNSDTVYHQSLTHLGLTHLIMEGVALSSHRHLSVSHPIFKILAPHFLYIMAINARALAKLVAPGDWIDQTMNSGIIGLFETIRRGYDMWRMDVEGTLPEDLKSRGLDDPSALPGYHYQSDASLVYCAINKYSESYVDLYYTDPQMLKDDYELQNWAQELVKERNGSSGGLGIKGVPGNGNITTNAQLTQIVTSIIYTCSVGHAAANFGQYEEYGYPLKYPATMRGTPPTDPHADTTEQDILKCLANREELYKALAITKILSERGLNYLGDFEVEYVFDPAAVELVSRFRENLDDIHREIAKRNTQRAVCYSYMDPKLIPNSISI